MHLRGGRRWTGRCTRWGGDTVGCLGAGSNGLVCWADYRPGSGEWVSADAQDRYGWGGGVGRVDRSHLGVGVRVRREEMVWRRQGVTGKIAELGSGELGARASLQFTSLTSDNPHL